MAHQHNAPGGLHVHDLHLMEGNLHATIADATGRCLTVQLQPEDHPGLMAAYVRMMETVIAASQTVMLDLLGAAGREVVVADAVDDIAPPVSVPCRICGDPVTVPPFSDEERAHVYATTRCDVHAAPAG